MSKERIIYFLIVIIFSLALTDVLAIYSTGGVNWDFIAHILYSKSLLTPNFYSALFGGTLSTAINYGNTFYFETLRAPLVGILMVPFVLAAGNAFVPIYLTFVLLLLLSALLYLSKPMKISPLLLVLLFFTPYVIFFFLMLNGTEIVTMSLLLFSLGLLLERRWQSGIVMALAGLAKYPSLIFVPLLLILPKQERNKAIASFAIVTLPWLAFNTLVFHNPIYSYLVSMGAFAGGSTSIFSIPVIAESLRLMLLYFIPAFAVFAVLVLFRYKIVYRGKDRKTKEYRALFNADYRYKVVIAILALGVLGWILTAIHGSINDLPRLDYMIYIGIALMLGLAITALYGVNPSLLIKKGPRIYAAGALFAATIFMLLFAYNSLHTNYVFGSYGSYNPIYGTVMNALASHGLSSCNLVSNDWVYLIYAGLKAHFPYYYNYTIQHYPVVFFTNLGSNSSPINFNNITTKLNYTDFFIALPKNYTC